MAAETYKDSIQRPLPNQLSHSCPRADQVATKANTLRSPLPSSLPHLEKEMAISKLLLILLFLLLSNVASFMAGSRAEDTGFSSGLLRRSSMEWPSSFPFAPEGESESEGEDELEFYGEGVEEDGEEEKMSEIGRKRRRRRPIFWHRVRYYISYAALSANRIPCPPRSGRSYYTHNCHRARGPVHPYSRNCEAITRCRR